MQNLCFAIEKLINRSEINGKNARHPSSIVNDQPSPVLLHKQPVLERGLQVPSSPFPQSVHNYMLLRPYNLWTIGSYPYRIKYHVLYPNKRRPV